MLWRAGCGPPPEAAQERAHANGASRPAANIALALVPLGPHAAHQRPPMPLNDIVAASPLGPHRSLSLSLAPTHSTTPAALLAARHQTPGPPYAPPAVIITSPQCIFFNPPPLWLVYSASSSVPPHHQLGPPQTTNCAQPSRLDPPPLGAHWPLSSRRSLLDTRRSASRPRGQSSGRK